MMDAFDKWRPDMDGSVREWRFMGTTPKDTSQPISKPTVNFDPVVIYRGMGRACLKRKSDEMDVSP